jgi:hypothetical protein
MSLIAAAPFFVLAPCVKVRVINLSGAVFAVPSAVNLYHVVFFVEVLTTATTLFGFVDIRTAVGANRVNWMIPTHHAFAVILVNGIKVFFIECVTAMTAYISL